MLRLVTDLSLPLPSRASWIELDAAALAHNIATFRHLLGPDVLLGSVLKGNAYGHGLAQMLPLVHPHVDILYFIEARDALFTRRLEAQRGLEPRRILVLGAVDAEEAVVCARAGIELVVTDAGWEAFLPALRKAGLERPLVAHVHVDTGLGREGFQLETLEQETDFLRLARDVIEVRGLLSHFANTEDVTEQDYAQKQLAGLEQADRLLRARLGLPTLERHHAASAAAIVLPAARLEAVRVGISLYGLWPSSETKLSARVVLGTLPELKPVLSWRVKSQAVKTLAEGSYVGYGCTWRAPRPSRVAVLPVGYYDGYPRLLAGRAHVLVEGRRCPVVGRVMMNHLIVDVTEVPSESSELRATLLGHDGGETLSAEQLAVWAQTIHYELVTRLGPHLRRVVV